MAFEWKCYRALMVPCTTHVAVLFMMLFQYVIVVWPHSCLVGKVLLLRFIPILQMRKLSNSLTQGHTAGECWSRDSNLGLI